MRRRPSATLDHAPQLSKILRTGWFWLVLIPLGITCLVLSLLAASQRIGWPLTIVALLAFCGGVAAWMRSGMRHG